MSKTPLVVLVWSLPEEPEFAAALTRHHHPCWVVPLRYPALLAARRLLSSDQILMPSQVVSPAERRAIFDRTVDRVNALWNHLNLVEGEPWLGGINYLAAMFTLFAADYWHGFMNQLPVKDPAAIRHYQPFSRMFLHGRVQSELDMLVAQLSWRTGPQQIRTSWRDGLTARLGKFCNHAAGWLAVKGTGWSFPRTPVLLCGLQSTDWVAQSHVVAELAGEFGSRFRWLVPAQDRLVKMPDELINLGASESLHKLTDKLPLDAHGLFCDRQWRSSRLGRWSEQQVTRQIRTALARTLEATPLEPLAESLAALIARQNPELRLKYLAIQGLLSSYDPNTIVVNSHDDEVALVTAWARARRRRVVLLPHGVHAILDNRFHWPADCVGVLGAYTERQVKRMGFPDQQLVCVGGVHVAQQGQYASQRVKEARAQGKAAPRRALFLLGNRYGIEFPDAIDELESDFQRLSNALSRMGWTLALRCHPRSVEVNAYHLMLRYLLQQGVSVEWSDGRASLAEDLVRSGLVLTRTWDGAALTSIYAGIPLVGWMSRPSHAHAQTLLAALPVSVSKVEDLCSELRFWEVNPNRPGELAQLQQQRLADFILDPWGPPYGRTLELLKHELTHAGMPDA
jgi:hypothetical protein